MESWVGIGGKEGRTNIQILAEPGIKLGILWSKGRDLTNCANHARPMVTITQILFCAIFISVIATVIIIVVFDTIVFGTVENKSSDKFLCLQNRLEMLFFN